MKIFTLLLACLTLVSCKTLDRASSSSAALNIENCDENQTAPEFQPLLTYLRAQLKILVSANPRLQSRDYCFRINNSTDLEIRSTNRGTIHFSVGMLRPIETDAQFAALLAHELAHIDKQHEAMDLKEFVDTYPAYQDLYLKLVLERQELPRFDILHVVPERDWTEYLDSLRSLSQNRWKLYQKNHNAIAKRGVACAEVKTWEKISPVRAEVIKKLPSIDYEQSLCEQFFQEFNLEEKFQALLEEGKEKEADKLGIIFFLNAAYPEDEYSQFFANIGHLGGGQKLCELDTSHGDCFRKESIRKELRDFVKAIAHPKPIIIHQYPESLADLKRTYTHR